MIGNDSLDSLKCPRCFFEFMIYSDRGECPTCGNFYSIDCNYNNKGDKVQWEYGGEIWPPQKSFKVVKNSKPDKCPKCAIDFEEKITWSDKFCVIRKKCLRCGITDSEIIRKESQNA